MDATNRKVYKHIFDSLDSYETEDDDQHNLVMGELVRKTYATKIADQCMRIADGTSDEPLASIEVLLDSANGEANNYTNEDTKEVKFEFKDLFDYSDEMILLCNSLYRNYVSVVQDYRRETSV
jgi:hypothetical protein